MAGEIPHVAVPVGPLLFDRFLTTNLPKLLSLHVGRNLLETV